MSEFQDAGLGDNPYRSPFSVSGASVVGDESGQVVAPKVASMLRQTQPWVRFLSVLGFVCSALMLVVSLGIAIMTFARPRTDPIESLALVVYILVGVLYFFPSLFLFRYASRINALWTTRSVRQLEDALEAQKSFWKFVGILMLVVVVLYGLGIALVILLGSLRVR